MFKISIGPSSSHTVGPMRAAAEFVADLTDSKDRRKVTRVKAELFGSLGATGHGHGSEAAVLLGLEGELPESVDTASTGERVGGIRQSKTLHLNAARLTHPMTIEFDPNNDFIMYRNRSLPFHPNGMTFTAWGDGEIISQRTFYSIGGGFVLEGTADGAFELVPDSSPVPHPFRTGADLLDTCREHRMTIPEVMLANELVKRSEQEVRSGLLGIWKVMQECVDNGRRTSGTLPGGLKVRRRANRLFKDLSAASALPGDTPDPLAALDWLTLWALAVNEENAAGGRVVTAPTNGAAGIIPSVMHYVTHFRSKDDEDRESKVIDFLLTAGAIGAIYQKTGSLSGAEVGCQGEVGVACSMAAGALTQVLGGTAQQVCNAAEIGMEHHLGLTCDPVGGLVQVPCIERNAIGSIKAVTASRLALAGDGQQIVSLDQVIKTMMQTGADMKIKYKETARGGLAVNIIEC